MGDEEFLEVRQAAAIRRLAASADLRAQAKDYLAEVEKIHRRNMLDARALDVTTRRVSEIGQLSQATINAWQRPRPEDENPANTVPGLRCLSCGADFTQASE